MDDTYSTLSIKVIFEEGESGCEGLSFEKKKLSVGGDIHRWGFDLGPGMSPAGRHGTKEAYIFNYSVAIFEDVPGKMDAGWS